MIERSDITHTRTFESPVTEEDFRPLTPDCKYVQIWGPLKDAEYRRIAVFMEDNPGLSLSIKAAECENVKFLKYFENILSLAINFRNPGTLEGIELAPSGLKSLGLGGATKKYPIDFLPNFPLLNSLGLHAPVQIFEIISSLTGLQMLFLTSFSKPHFNELRPLQQLELLNIFGGSCTDLNVISELRQLKNLGLICIRNIEDLSFLSRSTNLRRLCLDQLSSVTTLPSFKNLKRLREIKVYHMKRLESFIPISEAPSLVQMCLRGNRLMSPRDAKAFVGHPTLKGARFRLPSKRDTRRAEETLGLPPGYTPEITWVATHLDEFGLD